MDWNKYEKDAMKALTAANKAAGQAWVKAVVDTPIPTWGGASRATFQKLAQALGTSVGIGPIRSKKNTTAWGRATSTASRVVLNKTDWYAGFVYRTTLRHLIYNEYNKAVKGPYPKPWSNNVRFTPYNFQARGIMAWKLVAVKAKLPNPLRYIKARKI